MAEVVFSFSSFCSVGSSRSYDVLLEIGLALTAMVQARSKHNGSRARKPKPREAIPNYFQETLEKTLKQYVEEYGVRRAFDF